jgi:hypothetical protein
MLKLTLRYLLILSFAVYFVSCADEKDNNSANSQDFSKCNVETQIFSNGIKYVYSYSNNRISKISMYDIGATEPYTEFEYTYTDNEVTYRNTSGREIGTISIGTNGLASQKSVTFYQAQDPTQATSALNESYVYDANNQLTQKSVSSSSQSGSTSYQYSYVWSDGNKVRSTYSSSSGPIVDSLVYDISKNNPLINFYNLIHFTGISTKHLPIATYALSNGELKENYTYEISIDNKTFKQYKNGTIENTYTFNCP